MCCPFMSPHYIVAYEHVTRTHIIVPTIPRRNIVVITPLQCAALRSTRSYHSTTMRRILGFLHPVVLKESIVGGIIFHPSLRSRNGNNEKNCDGKFRSYSPETIRKDSERESAGKPLLFCSSIYTSCFVHSLFERGLLTFSFFPIWIPIRVSPYIMEQFEEENLGFFRPLVLKESIDGGIIFHPSLRSRNGNNEKNCDGKFRSYSP
ncbi:hypothetical protein CDAR_552461 [Caerostris darwini]|uniref:Uncharacterized protein n=1 Tax=Caerostris darwini TaxID=1538125 RepID=A0AAV4NN88_9ARAC|nr:hypothetical protein CDAR_552461 [Caerostris darwini]